MASDTELERQDLMSDFFRELRSRALQGHEIPTAALIYALMEANYKQKDDPHFGNAIRWIYHEEFMTMTFSRPLLLQSIVTRYTREHRDGKHWVLGVWEDITSICYSSSQNQHEHLKSRVSEFVKRLREPPGILHDDEKIRVAALGYIYESVNCLINLSPENNIPSDFFDQWQEADVKKNFPMLVQTYQVLIRLKNVDVASIKPEFKNDICGDLERMMKKPTPEAYVFNCLVCRKLLDTKWVPHE